MEIKEEKLGKSETDRLQKENYLINFRLHDSTP